MSRVPARLGLKELLTRLRAAHGAPPPTRIKDPFQQVLFTQVAYLVPDARRREAFALLARTVGLTPRAILRASTAALTAAATMGGKIAVADRVARMRRSAELVEERWDGKLKTVLGLPRAEAVRALTKFPMIGKPGAERILLTAGASNQLALDSNGLRVLQRIGYGRALRNYDTSYRSTMEDVAREPALTSARALALSTLLHVHGKTICRNAAPQCGRCALRDGCAFGRTSMT